MLCGCMSKCFTSISYFVSPSFVQRSEPVKLVACHADSLHRQMSLAVLTKVLMSMHRPMQSALCSNGIVYMLQVCYLVQWCPTPTTSAWKLCGVRS